MAAPGGSAFTPILRTYRGRLAVVTLLSATGAGAGVAVIAYINQRLLTPAAVADGALAGLFGLLGLLLASAAGAQIGLTALGHRMVFDLRMTLVKRWLDTEPERVAQIGAARILAVLSHDVRQVTLAFVHLPELLYGMALTTAAFGYLGWLSLPLLAATLAWLAVTIAVAWPLVARMHRSLRHLRQAEDAVQAQYQTLILGAKALTLNRHRAARVFGTDVAEAADAYRTHITHADRYHALASQWANVMVLGTIGIVFHLSSRQGWASPSIAATYGLAILFLRAPLVAAVSALPALLAARVALRQIDSLGLAHAEPGFPVPVPAPWQELRLADVVYTYPGTSAAAPFTVGPLNLSIRRGETLFVIGTNGSGKSTLAHLLTGLTWPTHGTITIDGQRLSRADRARLRQRCAAVFTDFHVFHDLLGPGGKTPDVTLRDAWLDRLQLRGKVPLAGNRLLDTRFSQGQRKRLALLLAVLEERDILLLDEWAADQDPHFRQYFYDVLLPELKAAGKTLIIISHDNAYFHHADHLWRMHEGRLTLLTGEQREAACRRPLAVEPLR